ncbi:M23 family metallopeptidase [Geodermatophilus sp. DSM 44513]|uniref:M23 family metallopeptidase n=1 Tax=Geodermatophilus sp. DSM 44513 TaxID=1528104 RepID=UPI00128303E9|nr:M23 family metallopeptidase [Geodermatophilus sp. DSM 44513]WNV76744.1 M23 family metallopeptidase [Geodermatophilus sp. DSM 44513]
MTQPCHDHRPDQARTSRHTVPTQRAGGARPSGAPPARPLPSGRRSRRGPLLPARRRTAHLAAALVGASALGLVTPGDPAARADAADVSVTDPVSVAEELGLAAGATSVVPDTEAAARLGELAASRTAREAGRAAAAAAQDEADRRAVAAAVEAARPEAVLPVEGGRLTSRFGPRWGTLHAGIDIAAPMRTPEYAAMDGIVLEAGPASGYGLAVYLQHADGDVTVYGHMDEVLVTPGQVVEAGETIALLGNRGQSTGPHLHFEVRRGGLDGEPVDPVPYLRERGVRI